jgi:hypothetical protein
MSGLALLLNSGADAGLESIDDDRVALWSSEPSAPGSRLELHNDQGIRLRLKVHRCVRDGARFRIEGRLIDATRRLRDELRDALAPLEPPHSGG